MDYDTFIEKAKVKEIIAEGILDPVYAMLPMSCYAPIFTIYLNNKGVNVIPYLKRIVPAHCFTTYWDDPCELPKVVTLNNSITEIGDGAFKWNNSFEKIFLPANLEYVGEKAFDSCDSNLVFIYPKGIEDLRNVHFRSNWSGGRPYAIECADGICTVSENGTVHPVTRIANSIFQSTP